MIKVLVVQNNPIINNKKINFNNVDILLERYKGKSIDLIVFPEVWANGWVCSKFEEGAENINDSETLRYLQNVAMDFGSVVIGGSFIQKFDNFYKNTCPVISSNGKLICTYDKMHLFSHKGCEEDKYIEAGSNLKILDLGFTKIGLSICYDIRFPELYRRYSSLGVEVFVNVAAWSNTKPEHWDIMHKARAIENQCFMIVANQTGKIDANECNLGHSMVINPWGQVVEELACEESCLYTEINVEEVRRLRKEFPLLRDRRDKEFSSFDFEEIIAYARN